MVVDSSSQMDAIVQRYYSRPVYMYVDGNPDIDMGIDSLGKAFNETFRFFLTYAGNRWVGYLYPAWEENEWSLITRVLDEGHGKIRFYTLCLTLLI